MDDFWGQVFWCAAQRVRFDGSIVVMPKPFGETEINKFYMTLVVEQKILGFEISVSHATLVLVKVFKHQDNLGSVESSDRFVKAAKFSQVAEELTARYVVEEHIERVGVGKGGDQVRDEGVAGDVSEDCALVAHMVDLLQFDDLCFSENFQCVYFGVVLLVQCHGCAGRPD